MTKSGKLNYTIPNTYYFITLLNTLDKALEFILAKHIIYLVKTHHLFSSNYLGIRCASSIKHVLNYITKKIYSLWNKEKIAPTLILDMIGEFDNISKTQLFHNL